MTPALIGAIVVAVAAVVWLLVVTVEPKRATVRGLWLVDAALWVDEVISRVDRYSGGAHERVTVWRLGASVPTPTTLPQSFRIIGGAPDGLYAWSARDGLHVRGFDGAIRHTYDALLARTPGLRDTMVSESAPSFEPRRGAVRIETKQREWVDLLPDGTLVAGAIGRPTTAVLPDGRRIETKDRRVRVEVRGHFHDHDAGLDVALVCDPEGRPLGLGVPVDSVVVQRRTEDGSGGITLIERFGLDGARRWSVPRSRLQPRADGDDSDVPVAVAREGLLFVITPGTIWTLSAVDAETGAIRWRAAAPTRGVRLRG